MTKQSLISVRTEVWPDQLKCVPSDPKWDTLWSGVWIQATHQLRMTVNNELLRQIHAPLPQSRAALAEYARIKSVCLPPREQNT